MIKQPDHPVGKDFDKAGDAAESTRQQQIAALTEQQREGFEALRRQQEVKEKAQRETQQQQSRDQTAERMRKHLLPDKEMHLRPGAHSHKLKPPQELHQVLKDHLNGRDKRVTQEFRSQLATAKKKAKSDIARDQKQAHEKMKAAHKRERDEFLKKAVQQRKPKSKTQAFGENAASITQRGASEPFAQAAKDQSWQRAFEKAAKHEADHEHQHDKADDFGKTR